MFVGLGLQIGLCYKLNGLGIVSLWLIQFFVGCPGCVHIFTVCILIFSIRKAFAVSLGSRTLVNIRSQRTSLELWADATLSVCIGESQRKCSGLFSQIYILKIGVEI